MTRLPGPLPRVPVPVPAQQPLRIRSGDNPLLQRVRRLARDGSGYRKLGQAWIEGEHLCAALLARGGAALQALISEDAWHDAGLRAMACAAAKVALVPAALFNSVSALQSPAQLGFVIDLPAQMRVANEVPAVVLAQVQDAGNVGSILRSAAAFGFGQVLALTGTAALWSPKVLRAGMGAHFGLRLIEGLDDKALDGLQLPLIATSSQTGANLHSAALPWPCVWVLGHEGQGVSPAVLARCDLQLRIPQPGGEESLNVAAAAAICLYESARQRAVSEAARQRAQ